MSQTQRGAVSVLAFQLHVGTRSHPQFSLIAYLYQVLILPFLYFYFHEDARAVSRQEKANLKLFSASHVSGKGPGTRAALF